MSKNLKILIYYSEDRLKELLIRIIKATVSNSKIIECNTYQAALDKLQSNEINILISDIFLHANGSIWNDIDYIPEEIKLAQEAKRINQNIFTIIVNSDLKSPMMSSKINNFTNNKIINSYLNATARLFTDSLVSQLELVNQSFKTSNELFLSELRKDKNSTFHSYWILIGNYHDSNHHELIKQFLLWDKTFFVPEASISVVDINEPKYLDLVNKKIINKNIKLPRLLISQNSDLNQSIKIGFRTLTKLQSTNNLNNFIYLIHSQLRDTSIIDLKKRMIYQDYWNWSNIDDIIGFSHEKGEINLVTDLTYQNIISVSISSDTPSNCSLKDPLQLVNRYRELDLQDIERKKVPKTKSPTKLDLNNPIQFYDGKEKQIIEELKEKNLERKRWEKMINILTLSDSDIAKKFLKDFLFDYSHDYWKTSLDFDLVSLKANQIIASLIEPHRLDQKENIIIFLKEVLTSGTEEAKLGCVYFITSFSDHLIDLRLFQPLLDLWGVYKNKNSKYVNLIKMALRYFIDSIEKLDNSDSEYKIIFKPGVN